VANDSVARFKAYLALLPESLRAPVNAEIRKQADQLAALMKTAAPKGKTGNLARSVRVEMQELRAFIRAGGALTTKPVRKGQSAQYDYALAIEHGTAHAPDEPFFFPSYRLRKKSIRSAISRSMKKTIEASKA
jgi:hypothetical protein